MIISRKLEHNVRQRLQLILSQIDMGHTKLAIDLIFQLEKYLREHVESAEDEKVRTRWQEEQES
jgi:hypothetical protein